MDSHHQDKSRHYNYLRQQSVSTTLLRHHPHVSLAENKARTIWSLNKNGKNGEIRKKDEKSLIKRIYTLNVKF